MIPRPIIIASALGLCLADPAGATGVWGGVPDPALGVVIAASGPGVSIVPDVSVAPVRGAGSPADAPPGDSGFAVPIPGPAPVAGILVGFGLLGLWGGGRHIWRQGAFRGRRA